jgi:hypothetical protein
VSARPYAAFLTHVIQPVDVARVLYGAQVDYYAMARLTPNASAARLYCEHGAAAYNAAKAHESLLAAAKALVPANVELNNPNVPDSEEVPLIATMGELRALVAAIVDCTVTP